MDFLTAGARAEDYFIEKKSKFIGAVCPVDGERAALDFIASVRAQHPQARHVVYAYILRDNNISRFSDAGEPSGTGGQPVLQVLQREGLTDVCITVTRYFGGVLLGAGGLTRAYARAAKCALDAGGIVRMRLCGIYRISCTYPVFQRLSAALSRQTVEVYDVEYTDAVAFTVSLPPEKSDPALACVGETGAGGADIKLLGEEYRKFPAT